MDELSGVSIPEFGRRKDLLSGSPTQAKDKAAPAELGFVCQTLRQAAVVKVTLGEEVVPQSTALLKTSTTVLLLPEHCACNRQNTPSARLSKPRLP